METCKDDSVAPPWVVAKEASAACGIGAFLLAGSEVLSLGAER
jgi:hypothetical protein